MQPFDIIAEEKEKGMDASKEDNILLAGIEDKFRQCSSQYRVTHTDFLDLRQRSMAEKLCRELRTDNQDMRCIFSGGYLDAERTAAVFLPEYASEEEELNEIFSVVRVRTAPGGRKLTHRDYLGSLTGLGLRREKIGDILVSDFGADIIILREVENFIAFNYSKAGRNRLKIDIISLSELHIPEQKTEIIKDTVASLRLDNVISAAFRISRSKAAEAVRAGLVFVNSAQSEKIDMQVAEGDKLVLRGKGKAYLREVGKKTRKNRLYISVERYL